MSRLICVIALIYSALVNTAHASTTYVFINTEYNGDSLARMATLSLEFTLSDRALQRGSINFSENVSVPGTNFSTGDIEDFFEASWAVGTMDSGSLTPTSGSFTSLLAALTFADGIPTGDLRLNGETSEFSLSGASGVFSGTIASDFTNCNDLLDRSRCTVTGQLVIVSSVPEPSGIVVLGLGVATTFLLRSRKDFARKVPKQHG